WIGGRSSNLSPGAATRLGPANDTGLARLDQWGSVRMLTPSSWISKVAWPTQVTVAAPRLSRMAGRSLAIDLKVALRGENVADRQVVGSPSGSSTTNDAPPSSQFSARSTPPSSVTIP